MIIKLFFQFQVHRIIKYDIILVFTYYFLIEVHLQLRKVINRVLRHNVHKVKDKSFLVTIIFIKDLQIDYFKNVKMPLKIKLKKQL